MKYKCLRCGHMWEAHKYPTACPRCKSHVWNVPKKNIDEGELEDEGQEG